MAENIKARVHGVEVMTDFPFTHPTNIMFAGDVVPLATP